VRALINVAVPAITFVLFVAVGLDLTLADFDRVRRQRVLVVTGVLAPPIVLPLIALALTSVLQTSPEITAALLLVAVCPIGGISNVFSYLAKASPALSIALTGLSSLGASISIPIASKGLDLVRLEPLGLSAPLPVLIGQLVGMLGVPVALGMWARHRWPDRALRLRPGVQALSFVGVGMVFGLLIADQPEAFAAEWPATASIAVVFVLTSFAAGWGIAAVLTPDRRDRFTIATEFGTRNFGVAIAIAVTLLGRVEFARFATMYFLTELPLLLAAAVLFRRRQALMDAPGRHVSASAG
jgi:BASS family bile acid:Na+ symporter